MKNFNFNLFVLYITDFVSFLSFLKRKKRILLPLKKYLHVFVHGKNSFAEVLKNLAGHKAEKIIGTLKRNDKIAKSFDILT